MTSHRIPVQMLGQSGCKLEFPEATVYLDPYLSNSVQLLDASDLPRLLPIAIAPDKVTDADIVLITHEHMDHCDPHTLPLLAQASPQARFIGPAVVLAKLTEWGIAPERLQLASSDWADLAPQLRVRATPAAHMDIELDVQGRWTTVGYLLEYAGQKIYLAGDTCVKQEIIDTLVSEAPIHTAFLPVNEHNFFKGRRGIVGNMSVREAFQFAQEIGVQQVVAVHWDMFAINSVDPDEIRLIHQRTHAPFALLIRPTCINLGGLRASVVIRTLNEAQYLDELLTGIAAQQTNGLTHEVVLVDSGSTDGTLEIAERHGCRILHIKRKDFSFGRSLNMGCEAALGDFLVITSGHCVPTDVHWLQRLCQPLMDGVAQYSYGRQYAGSESKFSEARIFAKYFPAESKIPQDGFYCNNANSALLKSVWGKYGFDEELTGLEDMELAQRLVKDGGKLAYVAEAGVYHHHAETWAQVHRRFEREAIALQKIMPQVHVSLWDTLRYITSSIQKDRWHARAQGSKVALSEIIRYRWNQYFGALKGNQTHKKMSRAEKERYFYPD